VAFVSWASKSLKKGRPEKVSFSNSKGFNDLSVGIWPTKTGKSENNKVNLYMAPKK